MADNLTPADRRRTMQSVKGKNTGLERRLFSMLAGMGLRGWKRNAQNIQGKPDIVFDDEKLLLFADGCYWHGCPVCQRKLPQTNRAYWETKIQRNMVRDKINTLELEAHGWTVIHIWEHELRTAKMRIAVRKRILQALQLGKSTCHKPPLTP